MELALGSCPAQCLTTPQRQYGPHPAAALSSAQAVLPIQRRAAWAAVLLGARVRAPARLVREVGTVVVATTTRGTAVLRPRRRVWRKFGTSTAAAHLALADAAATGLPVGGARQAAAAAAVTVRLCQRGLAAMLRAPRAWVAGRRAAGPGTALAAAGAASAP